MVVTEGVCTSVTTAAARFSGVINEKHFTAGVSQHPVATTLYGFSEPYLFPNRINEK